MRTMVQDDKATTTSMTVPVSRPPTSKMTTGMPSRHWQPANADCDALKWDGRLKEAEVQANCVRQEYAEGHHIDLPVPIASSPRKTMTTRSWSTTNSQWRRLGEVRCACRHQVGSTARWVRSTKEADGSQMRRVTKLTKKFARHQNWKKKTTSGICITKLVRRSFQSEHQS